MAEALRDIPPMLAYLRQFLGGESHVTRVTKHHIEGQPGLLEFTS